MKKTNLLAALLLCMAGLQTTRAQKVVLHKTNNQTIECDISELDSITFVEAEPIIEDGHEWVDLGLPSGTLWATCNVGANSPEEYGDYFAWGETTTKSTFSWSTYFDTSNNGDTFEKYNNNGGLTELLPEDDAATANWGSDWLMPSLAQIQELYNGSYTTTVWTQMNGVNGRKITSKSNGNSIFLPAAGYRTDTSLYSAGSLGNYWSRLLDASYPFSAYRLYFNSGYVDWDYNNRSYGRSVRPVRVLE